MIKLVTDTKRAALYLRRSTDRQEQSIPGQRAELERYADEHGFTVVTEYLDDAGYCRNKLRKSGVDLIYTSENFAGNDSDDCLT